MGRRTRTRIGIDWKGICARTRKALEESAQLAGWTAAKRREIAEKYRRHVGATSGSDDTDAQREKSEQHGNND